MRFLNIKTYNFRNLKDQVLVLNPGFNILVGSNGQGKTNLLEGIYYLMKGATFRPGRPNMLIAHGKQESFLKGDLEKNNLDYQLSCQFTGNHREIAVNGKKMAGHRLSCEFPLVLFSPESLAVIKEGPSARRNLIDDLLIMHQPNLAKTISRYQLCLKSRNKVLRDQQKRIISKQTALDVLESMSENFLNLATQVTIARTDAMRRILPDLNQVYALVDRLRHVDISVEYVISGINHLQSTPSEIHETMRNRHSELVSSELQAGITLLGPQKHEINFLTNGSDSRFYCSQGQQRALILAFKMAQIVYHRKLHSQSPILLLDDVMSELDQDKQKFLMEFLQGSSSQIVVTTTDVSLPHHGWGNEGNVFHISDGTIRTQ